ncbi:MAG TPA: hypothetical protein VGK37_00325 [Casimicrobiaceae bacterium]|jgi:hypothetical protein
MTRSFVVILSYVLVLLIGGAVGFAIGDRQTAPKFAPAAEPGIAMKAGFLTANEHLYGTDATYENALRGYLVALDGLSGRETSEAVRRIYAVDKALSLIRLADLVEKRGDSAAATSLTSDALAICSTKGFPYCSSAELRQRAQGIDALPDSAGKSR